MSSRNVNIANEGDTFVAVEERLSLGDPVGEYRRPEGEIGLLIVRIARRSAKGALQPSGLRS